MVLRLRGSLGLILKVAFWKNPFRVPPFSNDSESLDTSKRLGNLRELA